MEGVPTAPLLNYAMHLPGLGGAAFRGVIVSDVEGYDSTPDYYLVSLVVLRPGP